MEWVVYVLLYYGARILSFFAFGPWMHLAGLWLERCEPRPNPAALRTSMRDAAVFSRRCMHRVVA